MLKKSASIITTAALGVFLGMVAGLSVVMWWVTTSLLEELENVGG